MIKLQVLIADDENDAIEVLRNILLDTGKVEIIGEVTHPKYIESAIAKYNPDVLFLDIEMPEQNGLSVLENIRGYNQDLPVVFVTAFEKYMNDAIKLQVYSYLLKPVDRYEIAKIVNKLLVLKQNQRSKELNKIKLPVKGGFVYLHPNELLMLKADGNYTSLKTVNGEEFVSSYNMGRLLERLPSRFFRINRACILNGYYIYKINKKQNTCTVRIEENEQEFEVTNTFISEFNKVIR